MLCAKFGWNSSSGSRDEDEKYIKKELKTHGRQTIRKFTWAFSSVELKIILDLNVDPTSVTWTFIHAVVRTLQLPPCGSYIFVLAQFYKYCMYSTYLTGSGFVCHTFVSCFTYQQRIFPLYGNITVAVEGLLIFSLCSTSSVFEQGLWRALYCATTYYIWHV